MNDDEGVFTNSRGGNMSLFFYVSLKCFTLTKFTKYQLVLSVLDSQTKPNQINDAVSEFLLKLGKI